SATAPLLQKWYTATPRPDADDPYFLYAASNAGSLAGLLAYPTLVEVWTTVETQTTLWTAGFALEVLLLIICGIVAWRYLADEEDPPAEADTSSDEPAAPLSGRNRVRWTVHAFIPSSLMLGVTTHLTTQVASVPLLWIVPFVIYLGTFIAAFSRSVPFPQRSLGRYLPFGAALLVCLYGPGSTGSMPVLAAVHLAVFTLYAILFHGELAETRPATSHLTEFYLWVSFGGVLGGIFNGLLAPVIFDWPLEYPLVLLLGLCLVPTPAFEGRLRRSRRAVAEFGGALVVVLAVLATLARLPDSRIALVATGTLVAAVFLYIASRRSSTYAALGTTVVAGIGIVAATGFIDYVDVQRNFFGQKRVRQTDAARYLYHDSILHGFQYRDERREMEPTGYYARTGPVGDVFAELHARQPPQPVAVIGLGAGGLATYARRDQPFVFFEIDPYVARIAREHFTYLSEAAGPTRVVVGDGRLALRDESDGSFGMIVLDAFSGDAIPTHLLTRQAFELYLDKLADGGLILVNTTNTYVDLHPLLGNTARALDARAVMRTFNPSKAQKRTSDVKLTATSWVAIARSTEALGRLAAHPKWHPCPTPTDLPIWTDRYSNILSVLK
ncbi:MAG: spermidine synthase, partial [Bradymonadaceae bacterium]